MNKPSKATKKPVTVEFIEWTGSNHRAMWEFLGNPADEFIRDVGRNFFIDHSLVGGGLVILTLEGQHVADIGDMIIKGIKGEFYPCKPDIFHATYDVEQDDE